MGHWAHGGRAAAGRPWTYGFLANHLWGVAGSSRLDDINATFAQPFVSYTTPAAWTYSLTSESSYDWEAEEWAIPLNVTVSRVIRLGKLPVSLGGGLRWWADSPPNGAEGFGLRLQATLLFPKPGG